MTNVMSGIVFKGCYHDEVFVKLTCDTEIHNGLKYKTGLNVDIRPFSPIGSCKTGGMYFIRKVDIKRWLYYSKKTMVWMRSVKIPDDAMVYVEPDKFKCNKFILGDRVYLYHDSRYQYDLVSANGLSIKYITTPHYEVKKKALLNTPEAIQFIQNPSLELQRIAVSRDGLCLRFIDSPSEEICNKALSQNGEAVRYIKHPSLDMCKRAIRNDPSVIRLIQNPPELLQISVVKNHPWEIQNIRYPCERACLEAVRQDGGMIEYIPFDCVTDAVLKASLNQTTKSSKFFHKC